MNSNYQWNCYSYNVVNVVNGKVIYETDDLENARAYIRLVKDELKHSFCIQQIHSVARIIK